jgi:RNA polymerase sigma factor (sigma-70 family)
MDEQQANTSVVTAADTIVELHRYLEDSHSRETLYGILRSYVRKAQLVSPAEVDDEAYELLQNVVLRAIEIADKYRGTGITSWLLRIAINLIRQKKKSQAVHQEKVVQLRDLHKHDYPMLSDEEFFELFTAQIAATNAREVQLRQDLKEAITSLSEDDQLILNYYNHYGYDHNEIARHLGIKPGAARTRYSRAVSQLRKSLMVNNENRRGESDA